MEYVNNVFKQIGVEFEVRELIPDNGKDPHQKKYYEINSMSDVKDLMDMREKTEGIELYFIKGHNIGTMKWGGVTIPTSGCVISKYGYLGDGSKMTNVNTIAHEILHSMKLDGSREEYVEDIYEKDVGVDIISVNNIKDEYSDYYSERRGKEIIKRLLMYGYVNEDKRDIPRGRVYGKDVGGVLEHKRREMEHGESSK